LILASAAGCATLARRAPAPAQAPPPAATPPAPLPNLANAPPLAITAPPKPGARPPGDIQQVAFPAPTPPPAAEPAPPSEPVSDVEAARRLQREAAAAYARQPSYIARLRRREWAHGRPKSEETLIFKFREQPFSVHFKWLGDEGQGREVLYVRGQYDNKLHVLTAANDIPFTPAGRRMALALDSFLVRTASKYPITDAGIGRNIQRIGQFLDRVERGEPGTGVKYVGPTRRPEYPVPLEAFECRLPVGYAPEVPQGGKRLLCFDPATKFPVVSLTWDHAGQEVDFACFDRFQLDVRLDDDDFNPDKLWATKP
jgi:hypothetical protein